MNTAEITVTELLAAEGRAFTAKRAEERAFTAKRDAWASVIFAHTAEELDRATSAYRQATIAHAKALDAWYDAARAANMLR